MWKLRQEAKSPDVYKRQRLYVLAGGKDFKPENILFEQHTSELAAYPSFSLKFEKDGHSFEIFREYSDCLYAAYATKWNGNAAAYNGSLFVVQDGRIRRLSPLECERMMGFPDNYTNIHGARRTNRYQAIGNSWAVPVVRWIGERLIHNKSVFDITQYKKVLSDRIVEMSDTNEFYDFGRETIDVYKRQVRQRSENHSSWHSLLIMWLWGFLCGNIRFIREQCCIWHWKMIMQGSNGGCLPCLA